MSTALAPPANGRCPLCAGLGRTPLVIDRGSYSSGVEYMEAWKGPIEGRGMKCPVCDLVKAEPLPDVKGAIDIALRAYLAIQTVRLRFAQMRTPRWARRSP